MPNPASPVSNEVPGKKPASVWRIAWRVVSWSTIALGLLTLILMFHKSPPPVVHVDPAATGRLETKLQQAQAAAVTGAPQELHVDEAELNSFLDSHLAINREAEAPKPAGSEPTVEEVQSSVRDVKISLADDLVHAYVVFDFHGKDMTLDLEGRLRAENGYLRFDPVSGKIGALPIPQSTLETAVRRMMDSPENRDKLRLPDELSDLRVENGEIVVGYK
jgi:hypothetical protein